MSKHRHGARHRRWQITPRSLSFERRRTRSVFY
jgi:hypothetical protein